MVVGEDDVGESLSLASESFAGVKIATDESLRAARLWLIRFMSARWPGI